MDLNVKELLNQECHIVWLICAKPQVAVTDITIFMTDIVKRTLIKKMLPVLLFLTITAPSSKNGTCQECIKLVEFIQQEIDIPGHTIEQIFEFIKLICEQIHGPAAKECVDIANDIAEIIKWLDRGIKPGKICQMLKMCR